VTTSGATGQLPPGSPGAQLLGATPLNPERSRSFSAGFTASPFDGFNIQADAYQIKLRKRILDGGSYSGAQAIAAFLANGREVPATSTLSAVSASYLTNGADTRTRGLDVNATYRVEITSTSKIIFDAAANFNKTVIQDIKVNRLGRAVLNLQQIAFLTTAQPRNAQVFGGTWSNSNLSVGLHGQRYGKIFDQMTFQEGPSAFSSSVFQPFTGKSRTLVNLAVDYRVTPKLTLSAGGNNILNTYPTKVPELARYFGQALYDRYAQQIGFDGAFYYVRLGYRF
jgi:iron complex outermembrane receptor protein